MYYNIAVSKHKTCNNMHNNTPQICSSKAKNEIYSYSKGMSVLKFHSTVVYNFPSAILHI